MIDEYPILAVAAAVAEGKTVMDAMLTDTLDRDEAGLTLYLLWAAGGVQIGA